MDGSKVLDFLKGTPFNRIVSVQESLNGIINGKRTRGGEFKVKKIDSTERMDFM